MIAIEYLLLTGSLLVLTVPYNPAIAGRTLLEIGTPPPRKDPIVRQCIEYA